MSWRTKALLALKTLKSLALVQNPFGVTDILGNLMKAGTPPPPQSAQTRTDPEMQRCRHKLYCMPGSGGPRACRDHLQAPSCAPIREGRQCGSVGLCLWVAGRAGKVGCPLRQLLNAYGFSSLVLRGLQPREGETRGGSPRPSPQPPAPWHSVQPAPARSVWMSVCAPRPGRGRSQEQPIILYTADWVSWRVRSQRKRLPRQEPSAAGASESG